MTQEPQLPPLSLHCLKLVSRSSQCELVVCTPPIRDFLPSHEIWPPFVLCAKSTVISLSYYYTNYYFDFPLQSAKLSCAPHAQALVPTLSELYASVDFATFHHHMTISHVMRLRVHCIYKFPATALYF